MCSTSAAIMQKTMRKCSFICRGLGDVVVGRVAISAPFLDLTLTIPRADRVLVRRSAARIL